jgi:HAD superfamily hydrolase (TIGR01490 family)
MKRVAIFDIDGTIFRSSLLIELTEALIFAGIFPSRARKVYKESFKNWLDRQGPYEKYIEAVIEAFIRNIAGVRRSDFLKVAEKVVAFHQNRAYLYTRDLVKKLRKRNYYILAISHSPRGIVENFCKKLGFNKVYGKVYEIDKKGKFTGGVLYADLIADKAKILKRATVKENLTLKESVGVGDTESDIPFLSLVENPICFNPNKKLYIYARRAKWSIVVERKDVVYKMDARGRKNKTENNY